MQKALVAGGSGFIGSHLCEKLLAEGFSVLSVDNLLTGDKENIVHLLDNPQFTFLEHDIAKKFSVNDLCLDYIFHFASPASPNKNSRKSYINFPIETLLANSQGTHVLLELAKATGAKFLFASSSEVYGDPTVSPQSEEYFGNVNPNGVRSVYDEAKRFGEAMTFAYVRKYNLDGRIIRIFNTYGPRMKKDDGRVVSNFINQALEKKQMTIYGEGEQTRSFCFVSDMISGIIKAMVSENTKGEVINLGNPDERTILQLAQLIKKMTHSSSEIIYQDMPLDDPKKRKPDIEKAKKLLDWNPEVFLEEGLKKTIEYFRSM